MRLRDIIKATLSRPVAFHAVLGKICGSATAGLMLSQAIYWSERTEGTEGWFYKSQPEWEDEICLSRREQETARALLREKGFLEDVRRGNPARLWYRVNADAVAEAVACHASRLAESAKQDWRKAPNKIGGKSQAESANLDCPKAPNKPGGKRQSILGTETTTETTAESLGTPPDGGAPGPLFPTGKATPPKPKSVPAKGGGEPDPRHQPVVDAIAKCWPKDQDTPFVFEAADGAALKRMLAEPGNPFTADQLCCLVVYRFLSDNIVPSERVRAWIGALPDYASGPRDRYNVPKGELEYWRQAARRLLWGVPEQETLKPPEPRPLPAGATTAAEFNGSNPWEQVKEDLRRRVGEHNFETWLKPTRLLYALERDGTLVVGVPTEEFREALNGPTLAQEVQASLVDVAYDTVKFEVRHG